MAVSKSVAFFERAVCSKLILKLSNVSPLPGINWQATVYHGLPEHLHTFHPKDQGYLAFLGRISPEKRVDRAIEIAHRSGRPLKIAAKVDKADKEYYLSTLLIDMYLR